MYNSTPFYAAANAVLYMYDLRQRSARNRAPANSPAEIEWACEQLFRLADVAAYAGSTESTTIRAIAGHWKVTGIKPQPIPLMGN